MERISLIIYYYFMSDKKYIGGSAKAIQTQYGEMMNLSLKLSDMQAIVNEKGYVNMSVMKRKTPSQYGDTHSVIENSYKKETQWVTHSIPSIDTKFGIEDVPF